MTVIRSVLFSSLARLHNSWISKQKCVRATHKTILTNKLEIKVVTI